MSRNSHNQWIAYQWKEEKSKQAISDCTHATNQRLEMYLKDTDAPALKLKCKLLTPENLKRKLLTPVKLKLKLLTRSQTRTETDGRTGIIQYALMPFQPFFEWRGIKSKANSSLFPKEVMKRQAGSTKHNNKITKHHSKQPQGNTKTKQ